MADANHIAGMLAGIFAADEGKSKKAAAQVLEFYLTDQNRQARAQERSADALERIAGELERLTTPR